MSILTYPLGFIGGGKEFYNGVIENSLRFNNDTDNAHVRRTPAITGNRRTFTWSGWIKSTRITGSQDGTLFGAQNDTHNSSSTGALRFGLPNDSLNVLFNGGSGGNVSSSVLLRDPSAWYHIVMAVDTTLPVAEDRVKLFINGERDAMAGSPSTEPAQNYETNFNKNVNTIGVYGHSGYDGSQFDGYMTDIYGIDGYALGPENFGEYKEGAWIPKAYAGPPPLLTDSSSSNHAIDTINNTVRVNDEYYIGESAIHFPGGTDYIQIQDSADFTLGSSFTIDMWIRILDSSTNTGQMAMYAQQDADDDRFVWWINNTSFATSVKINDDNELGGDVATGLAYNKWHHVSLVFDGVNGRVFADGVLKNTTAMVTTTGVPDIAGTLTGGGVRIGYQVSGGAFTGWMDEIRVIKGDARPPRFYFGTNYGDQSGGVLPQRATSAHRFTDDERTVLLVNGQSANGHARAISLVDESGAHIDNIHDAQSNVLDYPTQDGVGRQLTMSGPQHTIKDAFIGNTSSIVFDGSDDYIDIDANALKPAAHDFTVDFWWKTAPDMSLEDRDRLFRSHTGLLIQTYRDGTSNTPDRLYVNAPMSGTNELTLNMTAIEDHLHNNAWHHISIVKAANTTCFAYIDGKMMLSTTTNVASTMDDNSKVTIGGDGTYHSGGYFDEIRTMVGSFDKPQIKWTHTQTAGAGNKDAYDIQGWRAHGHEFTDDNATTLLIHGDQYTTAKGYDFDGTGSTYIRSGANISSDVTGNNTWALGIWYMSRSTGDQVLAHWGDRANGKWPAIYISSGNVYGSTFGGDVAGDGFALGGSQPRFAVVQYDQGGAVYTAGDVVFHLDGLKIGENAKGSSWMSTPAGKLTIGTNISDTSDIAYHFNGIIYQVCIWNVALTNDMIKDIYDAGATADLSSGTAINSGTNYGTTQANARRLHYAMGNFPSGTADTATAVVDRSSVGNDGVVTSGAVPSQTGSLGVYVDSSSANSIHHALVSGGGVHHSKAVTLKSDGTNGTSTTDQAGNTIRWLNSNSTVTFANSSSFDYGNTAIFFDTTATKKLSLADSGDWQLHSSYWNSWTIDVWVYPIDTGANQCVLAQGASGNTNRWYLIIDSNANMQLDVWSGTSRVANLVTGNSRVTYNSWNHLNVSHRERYGTGLSSGWHMMVNGILYGGIQQDDSDFGDYSGELLIGTNTSSSGAEDPFHGYMADIKVFKDADGTGAAGSGKSAFIPPRFYLGNQAPESGASFTTVKAFTFDGTDDFMVHAAGVFGDTNSNRSIVLWMRNRITDGTASAYTLSEMNTSDYENSFFLYKTNQEYHVRTHYSSAGSSSQLVTGVPLKTNGLEHMVIQLPDTSTGTHKIYLNGRLISSGAWPNSGTWSSSGGDMGLRVGGGLESTYAAVDFIQAAFYEGSDAHHTDVEVKAMYDLGPTGNLNTTYSTGLVAYYGFGNLDAVNVTGGTATADTVSTVYDRKASGTAKNLTQSTSGSQPTISTYYYPSNSAKRLAHGPLLYTTNPTGNTAILGNNHYANSTADLSGTAVDQHGSASFGSFVDDEYTVLLLRGGHLDGNTSFYDGNTAAGETITFPAHSHSYGKTRKAKGPFTVAGATHHETTGALGVHGTSIHFDGTADYITHEVHEDFNIFEDSFTVECFYKALENNIDHDLIAYYTSGTAFWTLMSRRQSADMIRFGNSSDYSLQLTDGMSIDDMLERDGDWHHIAVTGNKSKNTMRMFIDGICYVANTAAYPAIPTITPGTTKLFIGARNTSDDHLYALMDEIRITKGIERYTPDGASQSGIVPSTSTGAGSTGSSIPTIPFLRPTPYVASDGGRGFFANADVKLWIQSDTDPGDTNFYDSSGLIGNTPKVITNNTHTAANRPQIKTANSISDYALSGGADGIYFDGTNDIIDIANHSDFNFETGDFTVEMWANFSSGTDQRCLIAYGGVGSSSDKRGWNLMLRASPAVIQWGHAEADGSLTETSVTHTPTTGAWYHYAAVQKNNQFSLFVNGVSGVTATITDNISQSAYPLRIGSKYDDTKFFNGYLDEIRISKMARYTGQGLIDSDYPNPSTEFGIQTEGSTYGQFDTQVTANTTYQRYNYQHDEWKSYIFDGTDDLLNIGDMGTISDWSMGIWWNCGTANEDTLVRFNTSGSPAGGGFATDHPNVTTFYHYATDGTSYTHTPTSHPYTLNSWHFTVLTHDDSENLLEQFRNGWKARSVTIGAHSSHNDFSSVLVGNGGYGPWKGRVAQFCIWGRVLTDAEIKEIYLLGPGGNWKASHGTGMRNYLAMGNQDQLGVGNNGTTAATPDTASTVYDRSGYSTAYNASTSGTMSAPTSDTKLLIHSNTDIDGDISIVDSSVSGHQIDRVVSDVRYANSGQSRSSLTQPYQSLFYPTKSPDNTDFLNIPEEHLGLPLSGTEAFTAMGWIKTTADASEVLLANHGGDSNRGWTLYVSAGAKATFTWSNDGTSENYAIQHNASTDYDGGNWQHLAVTKTSAGAVALYRNGNAEAGTGPNPNSVSGKTNALHDTGTGISIGGYSPPVDGYNGYLDQVVCIQGAALTSTQIGHIVGGGTVGSYTGNTTFGALGGLIVHEEYANTTTTANAATKVLVHSNNATHHSQGSRKFYNDIVNTAFYGSGTFAATPAAAPKGHEAAGYFVVTAASGQYKFQGNTHSSTIDQNPQLRLRRGYSYIFDFSDGTNSGHQFYFANSTANSTGHAYGSGGTSGARPNAHLTGLFGTNTDPNGAPAVTWTQLTATNFGDNSGTGDAYKYIKYEVPTDAPKNLYYRCSPHSTMGNAVFIMEATEPLPVRQGTLPALRTSGWNDRDYVPSGTNNSVMHFEGGTSLHYLSIPRSTDFQVAGNPFSIEFWANVNGTGTNRLFCHTDHNAGSNKEGYNFYFSLGGSRFTWSTDGDNEYLENLTAPSTKVGQWGHYVLTRSSTTLKFYENGKQIHSSTDGDLGTIYYSTEDITIGAMKQSGTMNTTGQFDGFLDGLMFYKGVALDANTVIDHYMTGRAGSYPTANSSCVLHLKADSTYGDTTFTDASPSAHTITTVGGVYHHINDDRTANTALYFDGYSMLRFPNTAEMKLGDGGKDYCIESWIKPKQGNGFIFYSAGGTSYNGTTNDEGLRISVGSNGNAWDGTGTDYDWQIHVDEQINNGSNSNYSGTQLIRNSWNHVCVQRIAHLHSGYVQIFINGMLVKLGSAAGRDLDGQSDMSIGGRLGNLTPTHSFVGWMDGIRITNGMPRYTSGIPIDGQSPAKDYDDGRSSDASSNTWATSSTRRYYGINTHTYLQTTEYSTDANTVLLIRGDDAETANDGVNMYGENGFHLEFKEVGSGTERDYNNFGTGVKGLGSDTSATQEFADDKTLVLLRSRPNQANGSIQFIDETDQNRLTAGDAPYHNAAKSIFSVDSNTANVSIASGGSGTY